MVLELSLACQSNDRTRALLDGRVAIEGCKVTHVAGHAEEIFQRAFRHGEFDISELSFSTHLMTTARGQGAYVGIPAFVSRAFRHSAIYIRNDRGIDSPADLRGRQVGVPDFQQTAGVWVRGMLAEEYGVGPGEIRWRTGGLEQAGRKPRMPLKLPARISVESIPETKTLAGMLAAGELDAVISPRAPSCFGAGNSVARLFPEFREAETHYYGKTGLFPIMHLMGIRRELAEQHPWLAMNVYKALLKSKVIALEELKMVDTMRVSHPWIAEEIGRVQMLTLSQIMPGVNVINLTLFVGQRLRGAAGTAVALLAFLLPPMVLIVLLASIYDRISGIAWVHQALAGIAAAAAGLTVSMGVKAARGLKRRPWLGAILAATFLSIGVLRWPMIPVVLCLAPVSVWLVWREDIDA